MKIQMLVQPRTLPHAVKCRGADYVFEKGANGLIIGDVGDPLAVQMFLARADMYRPAPGATLPPSLAVAAMMTNYRSAPAISEDGEVLVVTEEEEDDEDEIDAAEDDKAEPIPTPAPSPVTTQRGRRPRWTPPAQSAG